MAATRIEHDLIGDLPVPQEALYGVHTVRAHGNFQITGTPISSLPDLIDALACIKSAAAQTNASLGLLDAHKRDAIVAACDEIRAGQWRDHFVLDVIQGGAGTSTNMNANEVICNRALEILGHQRGEFQYLHPNEDVNMAQSTNDVYPTAIRLAVYRALGRLQPSVAFLRDAFSDKAAEFADVLKLGRTQLQDAVPMTLGQEFTTFAHMLDGDLLRLREAAALMQHINLGGTAIGTGITTHPDYAAGVCAHLSRIAGVPLTTASDLICATQDCADFVQVSGALKRLAVHLSKISNDLRLLSSGPRSGLGEINLPAVQAGSSIMPGKVNPVIPEVVNQIAFEVFGADATITFAAEAGQLQLNAFEPVIAYALLRSVEHLGNGCQTLAHNCVKGITANRNVLRENVERSISLVTALNPVIGYKQATAVAAEAFEKGLNVRDVVLARGLLTAEALDDLLQPTTLLQPRLYPQATEH